VEYSDVLVCPYILTMKSGNIARIVSLHSIAFATTDRKTQTLATKEPPFFSVPDR
jgi:hypothetical protein